MGESSKLSAALKTGRPVIVDFSATWCSECLKLAPTMNSLEKEFGKDVQFVTMDMSDFGPGSGGNIARSNLETYWWAKQFGVDAIPHVAFVNGKGDVITALVGNLPKPIL